MEDAGLSQVVILSLKNPQRVGAGRLEESRTVAGLINSLPRKHRLQVIAGQTNCTRFVKGGGVCTFMSSCVVLGMVPAGRN